MAFTSRTICSVLLFLLAGSSVMAAGTGYRLGLATRPDLPWDLQLRQSATHTLPLPQLLGRTGTVADMQPAPGAAPDAATPGRQGSPPPRPFGLRQLGWDLHYVVHKPFNLDRRERLQLAGVLAGTGLLYAVREDIREAVQHSPGERSDFPSSARIMGNGGFAPTLALTAYLASFITGSDREKETAQLLLESAALSAVVAGAGSYLLAAERPEDGTDIDLFRTDRHGVSLDVALAASVIPPLRRQYLRVRPGDRPSMRFVKRLTTGLLYAGVLLTAWQRMDADKHWAPDVFLGMAGGLSVGSTLCQAHDAAAGRRSQLGLRASPAGIMITWSLHR